MRRSPSRRPLAFLCIVAGVLLAAVFGSGLLALFSLAGMGPRHIGPLGRICRALGQMLDSRPDLWATWLLLGGLAAGVSLVALGCIRFFTRGCPPEEG